MARTGNKNIVFGLLLVTFVLISVSLYANLDSGSRNEAISRTGELTALKQQVEEMNKQLLENREAMKKMEEELEQAEKMSKRKKIENENIVYDQKAEAEAEIVKNVDQLEGDADHKAVEDEHDGKQVVPEPVFRNKVAVVHNSRLTSNKDVCRLASNFSHTQSDLQMLDIYDILSFDNPDGGVWKQGWEVKYTREEEENNHLRVIVIPHSHCDPGWIKTFEQYYSDQTREILSGMAKHLKDKPDMKFIYAEMSFFELWWREQTPEVRESVKKFLKDGQLEIVTGGWVMTDEANAHYFSIVTELFEGHEWLKNHADFVPNSHWSIDPFGLSPTLPFLLSAANITNAAIQRVHYSVKKHLAKNKQLEFMWRQLWGGKKDVRTHMFPFYSYDIPHTCGPEPRICCQFDFNRLPGGGHSCPWNVPPQRINDNNVEERAFMLYDQYRKKSQLYKTNVLLIPLGDDFRYASDFEWNEQHDNYKKLMAHMNSKAKWNVKASFGTLSDYFKALSEELEKEESKLPTLTGDFFTYADRDDHYWSGYFTSRPFYKQMDRVLQHYVRSADIAYTLSQLNGFDTNEVFDDLVRARRALSLFQHHDGVTGTAKDAVVIDYGQRMLDALYFCEKALSKSLGQQLGISSDLKMHEIRDEQDALPNNRVFVNGDALVVFNSLGRTRNTPICITVSNNNLVIDGVKTNDQQIAPAFKLSDNKLVTIPDNFELCFVHPIKPLSSQVFRIVQGDTSTKSKVSSNVETLHPDFSTELLNGDIVLKNDLLEAIFDGSTGYVKSVTPQGSSVVNVDMKFMHYGARPHKRMNNGGGDDLSGAYLFLPDGEASEISSANNEVVALSGPVFSKVIIAGPGEAKVHQVSTLFRGSPSIDYTTEVDIRSQSNYELAMRFISSVNSGDDLYTDLNGLQLIRRKRMLSKLPLQAHFYPMPGSAFIEDSSTRLSLLGAQALGVASLKSGHMEVMLDRRLNQDDGRGLFQGVLDNKRTLSRFRLLVEPLSKSNEDVNARVGFLSSSAHMESQEIHYPWIRMMGKDVLTAPSFVGLKDELSCDVHVVALRTSAQPVDYENKPKVSSKNEAALILFRPMVDCRSSLQIPSSCASKSHSIEFKSLLSNIKNAQSSSLTMLYEGESLTNLEVQPQEINTIKLMW